MSEINDLPPNVRRIRTGKPSAIASEGTHKAEESRSRRKPNGKGGINRSRAEWEKIEAAYCSGKFSRVQICQAFALQRSTLDNRIARDRRRDPLRWAKGSLRDEVNRQAEALLIQHQAAQVKDSHGAADSILIAAQAQQTVLLGHRDEVGKARRVLDTLLMELHATSISQEELRSMIEGAARVDELGPLERAQLLARIKDLFSLGSRTSSMQRLADAMIKLQTAERRAFQIPDDAPPHTPDETLSDAELEAEIERYQSKLTRGPSPTGGWPAEAPTAASG